MCADIAALLHPIPEQTDEGDNAYQAMAEATWQEREALAEELRLSLQEGVSTVPPPAAPATRRRWPRTAVRYPGAPAPR